MMNLNSSYHDEAVTQGQFCANRFKLVLVGSSGTGKTSLIKRLRDNVFDEESTLKESSKMFAMVKAIRGEITKIDLQELDSNYFHLKEEDSDDVPTVHKVRDWWDINGIILLYDTTDKESFKEIISQIPAIQRKISPEADMCLVGTKCDLGTKRQVTFGDAEAEADRLGISLFEISSKNSVNCETVLFEIIDKLMERREETNEQFERHDADSDPNPYQPTVISETTEVARGGLFSSTLCWIPRLPWSKK